MDPAQPIEALQLGARIHGLIAASLPRFSQELTKLIVQVCSVFRRPKRAQLEAVTNELPVLLLIMALQELDKDGSQFKDEEQDFLKSCLIQFFSVHYTQLYQEHKDPMKEMLARVDWYLDRSDEQPGELFSEFVYRHFPSRKEELAGPLSRFISNQILPEITRALDLAPRYRF